MRQLLVCSLVALFVLTLAACGRDDPSTGSCTGMLGPVDVSGAIDDEGAEVHLEKGAYQLNFSYAGDKLKIHAVLENELGNIDLDGAYLLPTSAGATSEVTEWTVLAPAGGPALAAGTLTITDHHLTNDRVEGFFDMANEDGTSLHCDFNLRYDRELSDVGDDDWD